MNDVNAPAVLLKPPDLVADRPSVNIGWLLFRALGLIYLTAFISFWSQAMGLIGANGIMPLVSSMHQLASEPTSNQLSTLLEYPTVFRWIGSSDLAIHGICFLGTTLSGLLVMNVWPRRCITTLWVLYLSLFTVSRPFLGYQWDILLLETSVLIFLFTPRAGDEPGTLQRTTTALSLWLLRLALFKVILSSGLVKLNSLDLTWQNLTALDFHFWTQPIPHQFSWSIHHLGEQIRHLGVWFSHFVELAIPWLILCSLSRQMTIIWLVAVSTILMLYMGEYSIEMVLSIGGLTFVLWLIERMLHTSIDEASWGRQLAGTAIAILMVLIGSSGNYGFFNLLTLALVLVCFTDKSLAWINTSRLQSVLPKSAEPNHKVWFVTVLLCVVCLIPMNAIRVIELVGNHPSPTTDLNKPNGSTPIQGAIELLKSFSNQYAKHLGALALVNSYGLFARMTTERYELTMEGSLDGKNWLPYKFRYKPNGMQDLHHAGLHMPRLDWQMWFAALYPRCSRKWIFYFMDALLEGSKSVSELLETNPFENKPPTFIRIRKVSVTFATPHMHETSGVYWQALATPKLYCPVIQRSSLEKANLTRKSKL
jgi:lipase maturation factor 1